METDNKKNQANYESRAYQYMAQDWQLTRDVYCGVRAMNESPAQYLKPFTKEDKKDYSQRAETSEFFNVFAGTINGVVGSVFGENIISNDIPPSLEILFEDIDLCGNDIASFLRVSFTNAVRDGHSFIFVDTPPAFEIEDNELLTLADVIDRRPFWVNYEAAQAINWQCQEINGKTELSQITFRECVIEVDGMFGEREVIRYRVLRRGSFELFIESKNEKGEKVLVSFGERFTNSDHIPIVVIYANRKGMLESTPPYLELLRTNLKHYNSLSKFDFTLDFVAPMPVFHVSDESDAEKFAKIQASANRSIILWGENADAKYLELQGSSVQVLKERIESAEMRMAKMGIEKYAPLQDLSNKTAFEISSDNQKEMSQVALMAKNLEDAVEQALYLTAELNNSIQGSSTTNLTDTEDSEFKLNINYDRLTFSIEQLNFVNTLVDSHKLSLQTFWEWLPQVMRLPKDFSPETELERLKGEASLLPSAPMPTNNFGKEGEEIKL